MIGLKVYTSNTGGKLIIDYCKCLKKGWVAVHRGMIFKIDFGLGGNLIIDNYKKVWVAGQRGMTFLNFGCILAIQEKT